MSKISVSLDFHGKEYTIETGRFAKFANGAVMVSYGESMVLVTVVAANEPKPDIDFLPLQVEYREKVAAAGKIPGGYIKREGRPSEKEILSSRLIDRPIRPMISKTWNFETQIIASVYSVESGYDPDTLAAVGASAALLISDVPFNGPISEVRVGLINGNFVTNPTVDELKESLLDITVAGTDNAILMVEGESKEISEEIFLQTLEYAHSEIKIINNLQNQLFEKYHIEKREYVVEEIPQEINNLIISEIQDDLSNYVHKVTTKSERQTERKAIYEKALLKMTETYSENQEIAPKIEKYTSKIVNELEKKLMRLMILNQSQRLDGRGTTDIRDISGEVGLLYRTHGSALFTRGETQSLTTVTLGTNRDEQMIDGLLPLQSERFMLHYNFPPFSTGEVGRLIGTSRREVGHGNLALRALKAMLPDASDFPYTIRVVSDILESNGSSSMATVCAGSMALFDAGVPMKKPVAGIAMGLIKEEDKVAVLSDILGDEDFLGDMDFKVAGTFDGITACQMDIKIEGLSIEIMKTALEQAKAGRFHILNIMNEIISEPRPDISQYAPRYTSMTIPQDMIGAVIGQGGETIRGICKDYNVEINIEDDGTVLIASTSKENSEQVVKIIETLVSKPKEGEIYKGTVKEIREGLGAFIEILPKTQGLLHISQIAYERFANIEDVLKVGDKIDVKLLEITRDGKMRLSRKALLTPPEGYVEPQPGPRERDNRDNRDNRRSNDRGGDRGRDRGRR